MHHEEKKTRLENDRSCVCRLFCGDEAHEVDVLTETLFSFHLYHTVSEVSGTHSNTARLSLTAAAAARFWDSVSHHIII